MNRHAGWQIPIVDRSTREALVRATVSCLLVASSWLAASPADACSLLKNPRPGVLGTGGAVFLDPVGDEECTGVLLTANGVRHRFDGTGVPIGEPRSPPSLDDVPDSKLRDCGIRERISPWLVARIPQLGAESLSYFDRIESALPADSAMFVN